jgi:hypothetical protein
VKLVPSDNIDKHIGAKQTLDVKAGLDFQKFQKCEPQVNMITLAGSHFAE